MQAPRKHPSAAGQLGVYHTNNNLPRKGGAPYVEPLDYDFNLIGPSIS
jgi:hypothetical protein